MVLCFLENSLHFFSIIFKLRFSKCLSKNSGVSMPLLNLRCCVQSAALKCLLRNFTCVLSPSLSLCRHVVLSKLRCLGVSGWSSLSFLAFGKMCLQVLDSESAGSTASSLFAPLILCSARKTRRTRQIRPCFYRYVAWLRAVFK